MIDTLEFSARRGEADALAGKPRNSPIIYEDERTEYDWAYAEAKFALHHGLAPLVQ